MNNFTVLLELLNIGNNPINQVLSKITVYQGDSFKIRGWLRDLYGRPVVTTGYTTTIDIGSLHITATAINNSSGEFEFSVTSAESLPIPVASHDVKFTFTHSSGAITRVLLKNTVEIKAVG